jgi:transcriptional regulator GlxA family with amidase domain
MNDAVVNALPTRFGFFLVNDFTLISMSSAVEPLRMANRLSNKEVYRWKTISETGGPVLASDGLSVNVDSGMEDPDALSGVDVLIICGGWNIEKNTNATVVR